jgi:hypothetical protein
MANSAELLEAHPVESQLDREMLVRAIEACLECSNTCTTCADACLGGEDLAEMRRCIRLCLDCADICHAATRVMSRQTAADASVIREVLMACIAACRTCSAECESHAENEGPACCSCGSTCALCAATCRRCEEACGAVVASIPV